VRRSKGRDHIEVSAADRTRIRIVANQTAAPPQLLQDVGRCAKAGPCTFALLVNAVPSGLLHRCAGAQRGYATARRR
jgi:hypothetical protein